MDKKQNDSKCSCEHCETGKKLYYKKVFRFISSRFLFFAIGFFISVAVLTAYAAWNDDVASGDTLTAGKWNEVVDKISSMETALHVSGDITANGKVLMGWERRDSGWQLTRNLTINCSDALTKKVVGGGCASDGELVSNYPSSDTQWSCVSRGGSGIQAFVICARIGN